RHGNSNMGRREGGDAEAASARADPCRALQRHRRVRRARRQEGVAAHAGRDVGDDDWVQAAAVTTFPFLRARAPVFEAFRAVRVCEAMRAFKLALSPTSATQTAPDCNATCSWVRKFMIKRGIIFVGLLLLVSSVSVACGQRAPNGTSETSADT